MKWSQSSPPNNVWTVNELAYHTIIGYGMDIDEQAYLASLQAAAVEYAETIMGCSLLTRTVTATFYAETYRADPTNYVGDVPYLPRGPIVSITSVTDAKGAITTFSLSGSGTSDLLLIPNGWATQLTVVYQAGYGSVGTAVPADIRHAIRTHVATLYQRRESAGDRTITAVPQSLEAFYRQKSRISQVA